VHVEASRALYREKFEAAQDILQHVLPFEIPAAAFFLWLNMEQIGGGEAAVKTFWKECGVKVLPGAYLAQTDSSGSNPGTDYIRIALVEDLARTREALQRLVRFLS
jgi:aspartate/methionine/tyrosine aminotransferase